MGRVGACGDKRGDGIVFALLQRNVLDRRRWPTREDLRLAIVGWIERTYHRRQHPLRHHRNCPIQQHNPTETSHKTVSHMGVIRLGLLDIGFLPDTGLRHSDGAYR